MDPETLRLADFDYELPPERIAQTPAEPRDSARLLVLDRATEAREDRTVADLPDLLRPGDCLVVNDTRVFPARLFGRRPSGGRVELLLLRKRADGRWEALARPARRIGVGETILLEGGARATIAAKGEAGVHIVQFDDEAAAIAAGHTPLPPYITTPLADPERYQTIFARESGSAAAPTAGLHFTPQLLERLRARGIAVATITLHIGLDTFRPVTEDDPREHKLHSEWYRVTPETAAMLNAARQSGGRIVAVGTTSVRTLETVADERGVIRASAGETQLYILPGYRFRAVDALMTNFHLPRSTLLMLVAAFAGRDRVLAAYRHAVAAGYRFYSFGDAMLIL
ncbi:MAG: tRNA preQ1(34) S-adenosylmethionine ribosyltransferase-isomerase QueA [Chloroflexota bacterium]|nr:tRNA preQ1(34) S-adenosylmethionine ribosyltransferase-isomerase QueA [Dehalococcoidia bacterium]MDW8254492.1 tRNA preQ1(34) S-adenosylmethionine ribosyltransferase-isomerase QueA [Chloroflexota bacterium]